MEERPPTAGLGCRSLTRAGSCVGWVVQRGRRRRSRSLRTVRRGCSVRSRDSTSTSGDWTTPSVWDCTPSTTRVPRPRPRRQVRRDLPRLPVPDLPAIHTADPRAAANPRVQGPPLTKSNGSLPPHPLLKSPFPPPDMKFTVQRQIC